VLPWLCAKQLDVSVLCQLKDRKDKSVKNHVNLDKDGKIGLNHEKVKLQRTLEILGMMDYDGLINLVKSADEFWKFNYI